MEICPRQFDLGKIGHTNSCFPLGNSHLPLGKMASIYSRMIYYIGSYRKDDVDCSENVVLKKRNNWFMIKKTLYVGVHHPFCTFVSCRQHTTAK